MKNKKLEKLVIAVTAIFIIAAVLFVFGEKIFNGKTIPKTDSTVMAEATGTTNEIKKKTVVEQDFINTTDTISKLGIVFSRLSYKEGITMCLELLDGDKILASTTLDSAQVEEQHRTYIEPATKLSGMKDKKLTFRIYAVDNEEDTGLVIMMNKDADTTFRFGGKDIKGTLCFSVTE